MSPHRCLLAACLVSVLSVIVGCGSSGSASSETGVSATRVQPNILLLVVDDLGWADLDNLHREAPQHSAHIKALADRGMRFTHAYANSANCAPSRAALMSGLHAARTGVYTVGSGKRGKAERRALIPPPNRTSLDAAFETLPERLQELGYRTGFVGKWHLGSEQEGLLPEHQGFDFSRAGDEHGHPPHYIYPYKRKRNGLRDLSEPSDDPTRKGEHLTDRLTDEALQFLGDDDSRPWFLTLSYYAVHTPIQGTEAMVAAAAEAIPVGGQRPLYTEMIGKVDDSVGRLTAFLDAAGVTENTLIVLTSDNGGLGGYQVEGIPGSPEVTSNAPLRGGKGMYTEGGIRVPFLVSQPGTVPVQAAVSIPVQLFDLYPTFIELAGGDPNRLLPTPAGDPVPPDGISVAEYFFDPSTTPVDRPLYWHFPGYLESGRQNWRSTPTSAIRRGDWKLRVRYETGEVELIHLGADPNESSDLSASQPEIAARLRAELSAWLDQTEAPMAERP